MSSRGLVSTTNWHWIREYSLECTNSIDTLNGRYDYQSLMRHCGQFIKSLLAHYVDCVVALFTLSRSAYEVGPHMYTELSSNLPASMVCLYLLYRMDDV